MKYLICYDVRNIQGYIFNTSRLREINGASIIVKEKLKDYLIEGAKKFNLKLNTDWKTTDFKVFNGEVDIEIAYVGGGNIVLLANDEKDAIELSKYISKLFIKETGSLSLAYSLIEIDYNKSLGDNITLLNEKLRTAKQEIPINVPSISLPFTQFDQETNQPLSFWSHEYDRKVSKESNFKLKNYKTLNSSSANLDDFVEKHIDSYLGIIHIDGNDMGIMISTYRDYLNKKKGKKENTRENFIEDLKLSREISKSIESNFNDLIEQQLKDSEVPFRMVLNSGDDITFIVKGVKAINIVIEFLNSLNQKYLCDVNLNSQGLDGSTLEKMRFSACAGIAFVKSHFPFNTAYKIAEECCDIAKAKVKSDTFKVNDKAGSAFDYYICQAGFISGVAKQRESKSELYIRPYLVNERFKDHLSSYNTFITNIETLKKQSKNVIKRIRNIYELGKEQTEIEFSLINSRLQDDLTNYEDDKALYYDAAEVIDLYE